MMAKNSIKTNFSLYLVNTIAGLLYPIVTFPYISRILQPEGVGLIQFLQSVINYFAMFAALGIPLYAVKEIARVRDDIKLRDKITTEIFFLHFLLTCSMYLVLLFVGFLISQIYDNLIIYLILSLHLLLVVLGCDWFYQGVEDFKYITIRSLVVRLFSLIALFVFVKSRSDIYIYAGLLVFAEAGNSLINFFHLRKYMNFFSQRFKELNIRRHVKPALEIFFLNIIVSIYVNLDSVMLGFIRDNESVGYYAAATRITRALCGFTTALGAVVFPRLTNYYSNHQMDKFRKLTIVSLDFSMLTLIPISGITILSAPLLIPLFCGNAYQPSIATLQILSPIMIFLGISGVMGTKVLYAMNYQRIIIICTGIGALTNFLLNLFLIPLYSHVGAAVSSVLAEFMVSASMLYYSKKFIGISIFNKNILQVLIAAIIMFLIASLYFNLSSSFSLVTLIVGSIMALSLYTLLLFILKNRYVLNVYTSLLKKIQKK